MKGVLFTAGLLIFAAVMLGAAITFSQAVHSENQYFTYLSVLDRINDNRAYAEQGIRDIINISEINVTVDENNVTITEDVPYEHTDELSGRLDEWKEFVENNSEFNATLDVTDLKNEMLVRINDAVYTHTHDMAGNKIDVVNGSGIIAYNIAIFVHEDLDVFKMTWSSTPGTNQFGITVVTDTDSESQNRMIDFTKGNSLSIDLKKGSTHHLIAIQIGKGSDSGFLRIDNKDRISMTVMTEITVKDAPATVSYPGGLITITDSVHDIHMVSQTRAA